MNETKGVGKTFGLCVIIGLLLGLIPDDPFWEYTTLTFCFTKCGRSKPRMVCYVHISYVVLCVLLLSWIERIVPIVREVRSRPEVFIKPLCGSMG